MADISAKELKDAIKEILKGADLSAVTAKSVRSKLEAKLDSDLSSRRKEIDAIIMAEFEDQVSSEEASEDEAPKTNKRKPADDSDSGDAPEGKDDDYQPGSAKKAKKPKTPKSKAAKKRKNDSDGDSADEDWGKRKKPKKVGGPKKQSAFTRSFKLSPELADVVGADIMPRHEVVKKLWAVIKERQLQDPKNKQFAICDDQLLKVFGIKRFRTFGMMKFLKDHFVEAA